MQWELLCFPFLNEWWQYLNKFAEILECLTHIWRVMDRHCQTVLSWYTVRGLMCCYILYSDVGTASGAHPSTHHGLLCTRCSSSYIRGSVLVMFTSAFLPGDAMHSADYAVARRLSVRLSHTSILLKRLTCHHHSALSAPNGMAVFKLRPPNRAIECRRGMKK